MAKQQASHAYRNLVVIMILLLVLAALALVGMNLIKKAADEQWQQNSAIAEEENKKRQADYETAVEEATEQNEKNQPAPVQRPQPKGEGWEVIDLSDFSVANSRQVTVSREDLLLGGMVLVNHWHTLPSDYSSILTQLTGVHTSANKIQVDSSSVRAFPAVVSAIEEMLNAAKDAGYEYYIIKEAFRSEEKQQSYWDTEAARYADRLTGDALEDKVRQNVNKPGTSEYQTGFAFRVDRYKEGDKEFMDYKFQNMEMSDWLLAHSWEYGIIFRFPVQGYPNNTVTDKSYKTGESKMLSIYRYVGKANAAVMHAMNFCMEEYIEYLIRHPHIALYENGVLKYEIVRTEATNPYGSAKVSVSGSASDYVASTDNMGGVIVAMEYDPSHSPVTPAPTPTLAPTPEPVPEFSYTLLSDGTANITRYNGDAENVVIPDMLDGRRVTAIGLDSDGEVFAGDKNLTTVFIPDSVTQIGVNPFANCSKLRDIQVSPEQPAFAVIDGVLFHKASKTLVCYPAGKPDTAYAVPTGIAAIGDGGFYFCDHLQTILLPDTVKQLGIYSFAFCLHLSEITVPRNVTEIPEGCFMSCSALAGIVLPDSVVEIGGAAFAYCKLTDISLPARLERLGEAALASVQVRELTLPDSLIYIGEEAITRLRPDCTFTVTRGSYAAQYCRENGLNYQYTDSLDWLNN